MIDKKMLQLLNEQIKHEFDSSFIYLSMSAYFEAENLTGMAKWMRLQAHEETIHAMKFFDYIHGRGSKVVLQQMAAPKEKWKSPLDAFTDAYKHEQKITGLINKLADHAEKIKDRATLSLLQWYIDEQVEEEANANLVVEKLKMVKGDVGGLLILDKELGTRTVTTGTGTEE